MSHPVTLDELKQELGATEQRLGQKLDDLALAVADVVTRVNDHTDERFESLEKLIAMKDRVDRIEVLLAEQFGRDTLARAGL